MRVLKGVVRSLRGGVVFEGCLRGVVWSLRACACSRLIHRIHHSWV